MTGGDAKGKITEPTREAKVQACQAYPPKIGNCRTISSAAGGSKDVVNPALYRLC